MPRTGVDAVQRLVGDPVEVVVVGQSHLDLALQARPRDCLASLLDVSLHNVDAGYVEAALLGHVCCCLCAAAARVAVPIVSSRKKEH